VANQRRLNNGLARLKGRTVDQLPAAIDPMKIDGGIGTVGHRQVRKGPVHGLIAHGIDPEAIT
jgi:hypothetical protein